MQLPSSPTTAQPLIEHLVLWGEVAKFELRTVGGATPWIPVLQEAGVLCEAVLDNGEAKSWALSPSHFDLLELDGVDAVRRAFSRVPAYRSYLIGVLAEGLVAAAKAAMWSEIETWTAGELAHLLDEINDILDTAERDGHRLIDVSSDLMRKSCESLPGRDQDLSVWDQYLLGRAGRPQDLFDFALRRFAPVVRATVGSAEARPAILRTLPLNKEDGFRVGEMPLRADWNTRRSALTSSIALFDGQGQRLSPQDEPPAATPIWAIQDALVDHPFYMAVVQLAIGAWRSPAATLPEVELYVPQGAALHEVAVLLGGRDVGRLRQILADLVAAQGYSPCGLRGQVVPPDLMENVLRNLLEQCILVLADDQLQLHPDFRATLMAERLRTVFRPGKEIQRRIHEVLQERQLRLPTISEADHEHP